MLYIDIIHRNGHVVVIMILLTYILNIGHFYFEWTNTEEKHYYVYCVVNLVCPLVALLFMVGILNTGWNIKDRVVDPYGVIRGEVN